MDGRGGSWMAEGKASARADGGRCEEGGTRWPSGYMHSDGVSRAIGGPRPLLQPHWTLGNLEDFGVPLDEERF